MAWQATADRFVAYFDMLGFKDFSYRHSHDKVLERMEQMRHCVLQINGKRDPNNEEPNRLKATVFSDSVLVVSEDISQESADEIIIAAEWLMYYFIGHEILAKGAIAAGYFTANFDDSTFCGRPLIDAYLLQEELVACATVLHHTAERAIDSACGSDAEVVKPRRIPIALRDGLVNHCVVVWRVAQTPAQARQQAEKLYNVVSGKSRRYVDNTLAYLNEQFDEGAAVGDSGDEPAA
jgi:hypothetical protein